VEPVHVAIIYHSATGTVRALARAAAEGAEKAGAQVRLRKVAGLAPPDAIRADPAWSPHLRSTADVPEAGPDDMTWADAVLFGTSSRFGNPSSQLRAFIDAHGALSRHCGLAGKMYAVFTARGTSLEAARYQARRIVDIAAAVKAGRGDVLRSDAAIVAGPAARLRARTPSDAWISFLIADVTGGGTESARGAIGVSSAIG
jgi:multimeric flavodoxin WrbA